MKNAKWLYDIDSSNSYRYSLGYFTEKPLLCVGVNPSTATPDKLDNTIRSVARIASANKYDGWIMINLYPQRSTNPNDLHVQPITSLMQQNILTIQKILITYNISEIWAAWGTLINKRPYLKKCLADIFSLTTPSSWVTYGNLSKAGHPHHPLYLATSASKSAFDVQKYLDLFK